MLISKSISLTSSLTCISILPMDELTNSCAICRMAQAEYSLSISILLSLSWAVAMSGPSCSQSAEKSTGCGG